MNHEPIPSTLARASGSLPARGLKADPGHPAVSIARRDDGVEPPVSINAGLECLGELDDIRLAMVRFAVKYGLVASDETPSAECVRLVTERLQQALGNGWIGSADTDEAYVACGGVA